MAYCSVRDNESTYVTVWRRGAWKEISGTILWSLGWHMASLSLTEDLNEVMVDLWDNCSDREVRTLHRGGCTVDMGENFRQLGLFCDLSALDRKQECVISSQATVSVQMYVCVRNRSSWCNV